MENKNEQKDYDLEYPVVRTVNDVDFSGNYSYAHYLRWEFEERLELIKGKVFKMSPAPTPFHQIISWKIAGELYNYLKGKPCLAFPAPFDVRLPVKSVKDEEIFTVVQPDISIVCDQRKIDRRGCIGAPEVVIEILSPGNNNKDLKIKFDLYQEYGVKEYWIVSPAKSSFLKYVLNDNGMFETGEPYLGGSEFSSDFLPDFRLNVDEVFQKQLPMTHNSIAAR